MVLGLVVYGGHGLMQPDSGARDFRRISSAAPTHVAVVEAAWQQGMVVRMNNPPVIEHTPAEDPVQAGDSVVVEATITTDTAIDSTSLHYRRGGENSFTATNLVQEGGVFRGTIPDSSVTADGVEYYMFARDLAGDSLETERYFLQVSVDRLKISTPPDTTYRLISIPLDLDKKDPKDVLDSLGDYGTAWRFFELRTAPQETVVCQHDQGGGGKRQSPIRYYSELGEREMSMDPGKAFWLIVRDSMTFDTDPGISVSTAAPYSIPIGPGFTFIGNPFDFPIPFNCLSRKSEERVDLMFYENESMGWQDYAGDLMPFEGYAVANNRCNEGVADILYFDPDVSACPEEPDAATEPYLWSIRILAQSRHLHDNSTVAAVSTTASRAWDALDRPEPPVIGEYVSVYFPHPEWKKVFEAYRTDVRPEPGEVETWTFAVRTNTKKKVSLTFAGIEAIPDDYAVWLVDPARGVTQDLRVHNRYSLALASADREERLHLIVGRLDAVESQVEATTSAPQGYVLAPNYPNPFSTTTTIPYRLLEPAQVTLTIYDLLGKRVAVLVEEEAQAAGRHEVLWDGTNLNSDPLASGIYVYVLRVGQASRSHSMVLIR